MEGKATGKATQAYRDRHAELPAGHWRNVGGLQLSTLGWGSYLGGTDSASRAAYEAAALAAMSGGINVLDTAANYRDQASERDLGRAIAQYVEGGGNRDELLVTSKAGFLHGDCDSPLGKEWFQAEYVGPGLVNARDIVANNHCLSPSFIAHQLERSRTNLGLETIDVYFVHNPDNQLGAGEPPELVYQRLEEAFVVLEEAADAGKIQTYGIATWDGLRAPIGHAANMQLVKVVHAAGQARMRVGGKASSHHFRALELPLNLAMPEAARDATQPWRFGEQPTLAIAKEQGWLCLASVPLLQGQLMGKVPAAWREALGTGDDLETAFQFARSVPGISSALIGSGNPSHVATNLAWAQARGVDEATVRVMMGSGWGHD